MFKSKKLLLFTTLCLIGTSLSGCSVLNNASHDMRNNNYKYTASREVTLHKPVVIKTFSENYYDTHRDEAANQALDNMTNSYLNHIHNLSQYNESTRSTSVSDDGDENGGQVIVDTITLTRK